MPVNVGGGGVYQLNASYDACNEHGVLLHHDVQHAGIVRSLSAVGRHICANSLLVVYVVYHIACTGRSRALLCVFATWWFVIFY